MNCEERQKRTMAYLAGELAAEEARTYKAHVVECASCAKEAEDFNFVWRSLDTLEEQTVPQELEARILTRAREAIAAAPESLWVNGWTGIKKVLSPTAPLGMGLVAAVLSAVILSSKIDLSVIHPLILTAIGALWTGLYGVMFFLLFSKGMKEATSWRAFAQASMIALGIFLVFTLISPVPSSINFCRYYAITQPIIERLSLGGSFFLFGALYALIPMSIAAYFSSSRSGNHPLAKGSMAGIAFVALLAPSIYLQCAPFALGVLLVWFGGAVLGSVLGGVIGYWVRYRFARG